MICLSGCSNQTKSKKASNTKVSNTSVNSTEQTSTNKKVFTNTVGNTNGNILQGALAAYDGYNIFYTTGKKLIKVMNDNGETCLDKIDSEYEDMEYLNALNGNIYYLKQGSMWKYSGQDESVKTLIEDKCIIKMLAAENNIFFISHEDIGYKCKRNILYKCDTEGKNITVISDKEKDVTELFYWDNKLYYVQDDMENQKLMELSINSKDNAKKVMDIKERIVGFQDGWIYFIKNFDNNLYRQKIGQEPIEKVSNKKFDMDSVVFNINKDSIYYTTINSDKYCEFYRITLKEKICVKLFEEYVGDIEFPIIYPQFNIVNNKMYYKRHVYSEEVSDLDVDKCNTHFESYLNEYKEFNLQLEKEFLKLESENRFVSISELEELEDNVLGLSEARCDLEKNYQYGICRLLIFGLIYGNEEVLQDCAYDDSSFASLKRYMPHFCNKEIGPMLYFDFKMKIENNSKVFIDLSKGNTDMSFHVKLVKENGKYYITDLCEN